MQLEIRLKRRKFGTLLSTRYYAEVYNDEKRIYRTWLYEKPANAVRKAKEMYPECESWIISG